MDVIFWYGIAMLVLALVVGLTLCTIGYKWSKRDGYHDGYYLGKADRSLKLAGEQAAARKSAQPPRHAKTQPRTTHVRNPDTGTWHLPIPGPSRPQPARDSGPGTVTLDKLTTTGEINVYKARTDKFITEHCT